MAFLFMDSFDHSGISATVHATKYHAASLTTTPSTSFKRTGTHSLHFSASSLTRSFTAGAGVPVAAVGAVAVVGVALYIVDVGTGKSNVIKIEEAPSTTHVTLGLDPTAASAGHAKLVIYRGNVTTGTLLGTSTYELAQNGWYYLELKTTIDNANGEYEVRVDGVNQLSGSTKDTQNGGTATFNQLTLGNPAGSCDYYMDDLYVCDGDGGAYDDFLGPQSIEWLVSQSGDGSNADWTPSTGSDNGAMVDESTPDDDSTYNASGTVGQKDTYNITDTSLVGTIRAIQSVLRMRKTENSARTIKTVFRSNGVDYEQAESEVLTTYSYILMPSTEDPDTTAVWVGAGVDALQVGPKVET